MNLKGLTARLDNTFLNLVKSNERKILGGTEVECLHQFVKQICMHIIYY